MQERWLKTGDNVKATWFRAGDVKLVERHSDGSFTLHFGSIPSVTCSGGIVEILKALGVPENLR